MTTFFALSTVVPAGELSLTNKEIEVRMARAFQSSTPEDFDRARTALRYFDDGDQTVKRRQKLVLCGELRAAITALIDPTFGEKDYPEANVRPPGGKYYPAGIPPKDIPDLKVRKEYEKLIADNHARIERVYLQIPLQKLLRLVDGDIHRHCIEEYRNTPIEHDALWKDLAAMSDRDAIFVKAILGLRAAERERLLSNGQEGSGTKK